MRRKQRPALVALGVSLGALVASFPVWSVPREDGLETRPAVETASAGRVEHAYGSEPLQRLDYWRASGNAPAPLILFVHGGGWSRGDKRSATSTETVAHLRDEGFAFASMNYRLVPAATVEQQASDVAAAVAWFRRHAAQLGIDASRIILIGHSAGAHLVALVGTDPRYMATAGLALSALRGVIALDGACYDVARQLAEDKPMMRNTYAAAFGSDPARQRALSPAFQAASPNAPAFLLVHTDRADGTAQAEGLASALMQAGTPATVHGIDGKRMRAHREINRSLGRADHPATAIVDAWLRERLRAP